MLNLNTLLNHRCQLLFSLLLDLRQFFLILLPNFLMPCFFYRCYSTVNPFSNFSGHNTPSPKISVSYAAMGYNVLSRCLHLIQQLATRVPHQVYLALPNDAEMPRLIRPPLRRIVSSFARKAECFCIAHDSCLISTPDRFSRAFTRA